MTKVRVLLVEDSPTLLRLIKANLEAEGLIVTPTRTADEAERLALSGRFDMLVTDWHLDHGRDGFEVLASLRRNSPHLLSVLISSDANIQLIEHARQAGFNLVLPKVPHWPEIGAAVSALAKTQSGEVSHEPS